MTGRSASAAVSAMMWMLSASSRSRCVKERMLGGQVHSAATFARSPRARKAAILPPPFPCSSFSLATLADPQGGQAQLREIQWFAYCSHRFGHRPRRRVVASAQRRLPSRHPRTPSGGPRRCHQVLDGKICQDRHDSDGSLSTGEGQAVEAQVIEAQRPSSTRSSSRPLPNRSQQGRAPHPAEYRAAAPAIDAAGQNAAELSGCSTPTRTARSAATSSSAGRWPVSTSSILTRTAE